MLAGISVEYYTQLERGDVKGVSEDVLEAVTRALQLDDIERAHLVRSLPCRETTPDPATGQAAGGSTGRATWSETTTHGAGFIRNPRADFLTGNRLAYADAFTSLDRPVSLPCFVFLNPKLALRPRVGRPRLGDGRQPARRAARDPYDRDLTELIGELSMRSDDFRRMWATHDVTQYRSSIQYFHHDLVGDLDLSYESFDLAGDIAQTLIVGTAEPGSPSLVALLRLAGGVRVASQHLNTDGTRGGMTRRDRRFRARPVVL